MRWKQRHDLTASTWVQVGATEVSTSRHSQTTQRRPSFHVLKNLILPFRDSQTETTKQDSRGVYLGNRTSFQSNEDSQPGGGLRRQDYDAIFVGMFISLP